MTFVLMRKGELMLKRRNDVFPFNMVFEGDSAMVIHALRSCDYDLSKVGHIFEMARTKACLFPFVAFQHVKREGNRH